MEGRRREGRGGTPRRGGGEPRRVAGRTEGEAAEARRAPGGRELNESRTLVGR